MKMAGYLAWAVALADESAAARDFVDRVATDYLLLIHPKNKEMWTGFQQAGQTGYGPGIQVYHNAQIVHLLKSFSGSPSLDLTGGSWLKNFLYAEIYTSLPNNPAKFVPWGEPGIADTATQFYSQRFGPLLIDLYGTNSTEVKYWNYWIRTGSNQYTEAAMSTNPGPRFGLYANLFMQESDPTTNYSALETERAFNVADTVGVYPISAFVSRTGWASASDSLVFQAAFSLNYTVDHIGPGAPGAYKVFKGGWVLTEDSPTDTGSGTTTNMLLFGDAANMKSGNADHRVRLDRSKAGTGWAMSHTDMVDAYTSATAVSRAKRTLVHFKKVASPDYVVVYDTAATGSAKTIGQNLHYDKTSGQTSTMTDQTLPSLVWTGQDRRVSTAVVLPSGTGVASTYANLTDSHRENICASTNGISCASVTAAEFLIVHKPSTSINDAMPTVAALGTIDADFSGVQIEDATAPSVAVFAKAGTDQAAGSFTTTHSGTAQYIISGVSAGTYDVLRGATPVLNDFVVDANGVIPFESVSGAFTFSQGASPPAITITTTTLPNCVQFSPCSSTLAYSGGTPPVTWSKVSGDFCDGETMNATTGEISGTPTTIQTCNFTMRATDDLAQTDDQALSRTIVTPPPSMAVSASPGSNGVIIKFGTSGLDAQQSCTVDVFDSEIDSSTGLPRGLAGSAISLGGRSSRVISVGGLLPEHNHTISVICGVVASGSATFKTTASLGGTVSWHYDAVPSAYLQAQSAAKLTVEYNLSGQSPLSETNAACSSGCRVTLTLTSGAVYEIRHLWKTAADVILATTSLSPVAVP